MFTVGVFSKIAQVSTRLLRYYDEIGLFTPAHIDSPTGRRYYAAAQMPKLNRILALKDLGLSLEQIQHLVQEQVTTDDMQHMLMQKKNEIEMQLQEELERIRRIETRLAALQQEASGEPLNVVIKEIPPQPVLRTMLTSTTFEKGIVALNQIRRFLPENKKYGFIYCICQEDDYTAVDINEFDLEVGCILKTDHHKDITIAKSLHMEFEVLPPVQMMATSVVHGPFERLLLGYAQIATWTELNGYTLTGLPREITLHLPDNEHGSELISEVQFPIERPMTH